MAVAAVAVGTLKAAAAAKVAGQAVVADQGKAMPVGGPTRQAILQVVDAVTRLLAVMQGARAARSSS